MSPSPSAASSESRPARFGPWLASTLLAISFLGAVGMQLISARSQARSTDLLRLENRMLDQEVRLLRQQLEAERILAVAQDRLLGGANDSRTPNAPSEANNP